MPRSTKLPTVSSEREHDPLTHERLLSALNHLRRLVMEFELIEKPALAPNQTFLSEPVLPDVLREDVQAAWKASDTGEQLRRTTNAILTDYDHRRNAQLTAWLAASPEQRHAWLARIRPELGTAENRDALVSVFRYEEALVALRQSWASEHEHPSAGEERALAYEVAVQLHVVPTEEGVSSLLFALEEPIEAVKDRFDGGATNFSDRRAINIGLALFAGLTEGRVEKAKTAISQNRAAGKIGNRETAAGAVALPWVSWSRFEHLDETRGEGPTVVFQAMDKIGTLFTTYAQLLQAPPLANVRLTAMRLEDALAFLAPELRTSLASALQQIQPEEFRRGIAALVSDMLETPMVDLVEPELRRFERQLAAALGLSGPLPYASGPFARALAQVSGSTMIDPELWFRSLLVRTVL